VIGSWFSFSQTAPLITHFTTANFPADRIEIENLWSTQQERNRIAIMGVAWVAAHHRQGLPRVRFYETFKYDEDFDGSEIERQTDKLLRYFSNIALAWQAGLLSTSDVRPIQYYVLRVIRKVEIQRFRLQWRTGGWPGMDHRRRLREPHRPWRLLWPSSRAFIWRGSP
jgi:hypothetical protein